MEVKEDLQERMRMLRMLSFSPVPGKEWEQRGFGGEKQKCDTSETGPPGRQGELLIPSVIAISGDCMG